MQHQSKQMGSRLMSRYDTIIMALFWQGSSSSTTQWEQAMLQAYSAHLKRVLLCLAGWKGFWPPVKSQVLVIRKIPNCMGEQWSLRAGSTLVAPRSPSSWAQLGSPNSLLWTVSL